MNYITFYTKGYKSLFVINGGFLTTVQINTLEYNNIKSKFSTVNENTDYKLEGVYLDLILSRLNYLYNSWINESGISSWRYKFVSFNKKIL
jgi:hypothetical protein